MKVLVVLLDLIFMYSFFSLTYGHSEHKFDGNRAHSSHEDHVAFLGEELAKEFDKLTPQESRRRLRMLVPKIDINKDGFVEEAELEIWVRHKIQKWTVDEDVGAIFRDMDMDNNNKVDWDEYVYRTFGFKEQAMHARWERSDLQKYVDDDKKKWRYADQDKDGLLTRQEFEHFHHPKEHEAMLTYVAVVLMDEADKDKDGFLSLKEFLDWLDKPSFRTLDSIDFREKYDTDHDGKLNLREVEDWRRPRNYNQALGEAQHLIEYTDMNKDGKLTADEIVTSHEFFAGSYATQFSQSFHDEF